MDDFFEFIIGEPASELDAAPYGGGRFPVETVLDGRTFAKFHLDIGAGHLQREPPEFVRPRDWLAFAGIPTAVFPSICREEHFAQKLHAYTLSRKRPNSRVKDLVDLVLLIDGGGLNRKRLRRDIADTFARRKTHEPPASLDSPPDFWRPTFERVATECGLGPDISAQFEKVRRFYAGLSPD